MLEDTQTNTESISLNGTENTLTEFEINPAQLHYSNSEQIGQGAFGTVFKGIYLESTVAVKVLRRGGGDFETETRFLRRLSHPNIVLFIGTTILNSGEACIVTEYLENRSLSDLFDKIRRKTCTLDFHWAGTQVSKTTMIKEIASGLAYLHGYNPKVIHRDLKSANILLSDNYHAKIGDFGVSRYVEESEIVTTAGSNLWMAPEMVLGKPYSEKVDIYSLGVIMTELDTTKVPFHDAYHEATDTSERLRMNGFAIMQGVAHRNLRPSFSTTCPRHIVELGKRCMADEPGERPTAIEIIQQVRQW